MRRWSKEITDNPVHEHISTSYVERQNLTMRMSMRRFIRLTNGFSKKLENLEAGVSGHVWSFEEVIALLDARSR